MLAALTFVLFVAVVIAVSRRPRGGRVRVTTCCGARPWPPDDLTGADGRRRS